MRAQGAGQRSARRHSRVGHTPPFAAGVASLFTLALAVLVRDAAGVPGPGIVTILLVALAPLANQALTERFDATAFGTAGRLRALVVTLLVAYLALAIERSGPLAARFVPDPLFIWRLVLVFIAWVVASALFRSVSDRRMLLRAVYREREGPARERVLKELAEVTAEAMERLASERRLTTGLLIILLLTALLGWLTAAPPSNTAFFLIAGFAILRYITVATYDSFLDEYRYIADGNRLPSRYRRRRLRHAATLVLAAGLLALPLSGDESLLPPQWIGGMIGAFSELFPGIESDSQPTPPPDRPGTVEMFEDLQSDLGVEEDPSTPDWVIWLFTVLERLALTALISAVAIFLLSPLFTDEMRRKLRRGRVVAAIALWASTLAARFMWLWRAIAFVFTSRWRRRRRGERSDTDYTAHRPRRRGDSAAALTAAQKRALERAEKRFEKLERWAHKHGVPRRESEPPTEFALRLASVYVGLREALLEFALYYEQAVFSKTGLSDAQWRHLDSALKQVLQAK
ncbi:MAG: DUF4129 domain-containing protein [Spirochaetales bacterium]